MKLWSRGSGSLTGGGHVDGVDVGGCGCTGLGAKLGVFVFV